MIKSRFSPIVLIIFFGLAIHRPAWSDETRRYAVIVGTNRAPDLTKHPLQYADDDAARQFALFSRLAVRVRLLSILDQPTQQRFPGLAQRAEPPTKANLARALNELFIEIEAAEQQGIETEFYFVYSGHGRLLSGEEGAVTLLDAELLRADLYEMVLQKSPADFNHLIIDACNAYFLVHRRGEAESWQDDSSGQQRVVVQSFFEKQDLARFPNTGVVLSTSTAAQTHEWALYQGGVFSHEIHSGLLGAADITADGFVEYSEIRAFVQAANHRIADPNAKIDIFVQPPSRDRNRPLIDLMALNDPSFLDIPRQITGRFYLENERGIRLADFNKTGEQGLSIALLPAETYFLRDEARGQEYLIPYVAGTRYNLANLSSRPLSVSAKGAVEQTFHNDLFTQPFGEGFYAGITEASGAVVARPLPREEWQTAQIDRRDWRKPAAWTSLGLGVGTLAGAGVFTYLAADNAAKYRDSMTENLDFLDKRDRYTYLAAGMYGASVLLFGLAGYWWITLRQRAEGTSAEDFQANSRRLQLIPAVAPEELHLGVIVQF